MAPLEVIGTYGHMDLVVTFNGGTFFSPHKGVHLHSSPLNYLNHNIMVLQMGAFRKYFTETQNHSVFGQLEYFLFRREERQSGSSRVIPSGVAPAHNGEMWRHAHLARRSRVETKDETMVQHGRIRSLLTRTNY